jgi:hypothetical protein
LRDAEHSHALIDLFLTVNQVFGEGIDPLLFDVIAIAKETVAALGYNELKDVLPHFWLLLGQKTQSALLRVLLGLLNHLRLFYHFRNVL